MGRKALSDTGRLRVAGQNGMTRGIWAALASRRGFLAAGLAAPALTTRARSQGAEAAARLIVPFSAGTSIDALARAFAEALAPEIGARPVVVNRDGAAGTLGFVDLAQAAPDGSTLVFAGPTQLTVHPHLRRDPRLNVGDYVAICQVYELYFVLVGSRAAGFANTADFVARARANPGSLKIGHQGRAAATHLQLMGFTGAAGISVNDIPYRAHGQLLADLASGQLDGAVVASAAFDPALAPPLAIFAEKPSPLYPGLPTMVAEGYPIALQAFGGLYARTGLSPERQRTLEAAGRRAFETPAFQEQVRRLGCDPVYGDSAAFTARLKAESQAMQALLSRLGLMGE